MPMRRRDRARRVTARRRGHDACRFSRVRGAERPSASSCSATRRGFRAAVTTHPTNGLGEPSRERSPWAGCTRAQLRCLPRAVRRVPGSRREWRRTVRVTGRASLTSSTRPARSFRQCTCSMASHSRSRRGDVVRFEAQGEPEDSPVALEPARRGCSRPGRAERWASCWPARPTGWSARPCGDRRSGLPDGLNPFAHHPGARLVLIHAGTRVQPEHGARRRVSRHRSRPTARAIRPAALCTGRAGLQGHFHAAVVPYRPLPRGPSIWHRRSLTCSSPAGSRRFSTCSATRGRSWAPARAGLPRGAIWYVPLADGEGWRLAMTLLIGSWTVGLILAFSPSGYLSASGSSPFPISRPTGRSRSGRRSRRP